MLIPTEEKERLLQTLAEIGGKGFKEEDIVYEGQKLVLPTKFQGNLEDAIEFLKDKMEEEESLAEFTRIYNCRPFDGAYNAFNAMKRAFGMMRGKTTWSFFGPNRPEYKQVPISVSETEEVPWGTFTIPLLEETTITFHSVQDRERGILFSIFIETPRKNRFVCEGIFKLVEDEIKEHSIYRGKAVDGQLNFIDLSGVQPEKVVYSSQTLAELEANVWGFMRLSDILSGMGQPNKRSILLTGPYGTGKTMTANVTAIKAIESGWTFIMARPGRDKFMDVMQTAKLYQPAVVFMEDADTFASLDSGNQDHISELLDVFDGIQAKSTKLMVVLTTNHPDKLTEGMRRPGRIDQVIDIGPLDRAGIEKLITLVVGDKLEKNIDFDKVCDACEGYMPAFIKEAADRSVRYALVRTGDVKFRITTEDLVHAAASLKLQQTWMSGKVDRDEPEYDLRKIVRAESEKATAHTIADLAAPADGAVASVWNQRNLAKAQKNGNS